MKSNRLQKAFTLIELLIVVAIIAILAAIAVPNFLEAQIRSKVSRTVSDLRTLATAIEAYAVDNNHHPIDGHKNDGQAFWYLPGGPTTEGGVAGVSSPVAYITSVRLMDPFRTAEDAAASHAANIPDSQFFEVSDYTRYRYINHRYTYSGSATLKALGGTYIEVYGFWRLVGAGPRKTWSTNTVMVPGHMGVGLNVIYDPTNGTISRGNIVRSQKFAQHPGPHGPGY